ncbi:MAG: FAD-binding protein [Deltaproteobacteria bacterium]|nr:FAD-binding protein [Deltaproteobacteria bacterium]
MEPKVRSALVDLLGEARVQPDPDLSEVLVVSANAVSDVQGILSIARHNGVPCLPKADGLPRRGLVAPEGGGLRIDLMGMNRVLEVNHSERYAVIEPGVTWQHLADRLAEDGRDLQLPTAAAPGHLSVWASSLMDGAGGLALSHGGLGRLVWGVEAVLVSGEVIRTGAGSAAGGWWGRGPLPDLTGLFLGWRGATGLVTRLAISLRARKKHQRRLIFPASHRRTAVAGAIRLSREGLFDEASVLPWTLPRVLMGLRGYFQRQQGEPEGYLHVDFTADTLPELEYKRLRLSNALAQASRRGGSFGHPVTLEDLASMGEPLEGLRDLPLRLVIDEGDDEVLSGLGFHGPTSGLVDVAAQVEEAFEAQGLSAVILVRPVHGAHSGIVHAFVACPWGECDTDSPEDRSKREQLSRIGMAQERGMEEALELGFVPHRYPPELGRLVTAKMHPGSHRLALRLRRLLDAEALLDPARWGLVRPA